MVYSNIFSTRFSYQEISFKDKSSNYIIEETNKKFLLLEDYLDNVNSIIKKISPNSNSLKNNSDVDIGTVEKSSIDDLFNDINKKLFTGLYYSFKSDMSSFIYSFDHVSREYPMLEDLSTIIFLGIENCAREIRITDLKNHYIDDFRKYDALIKKINKVNDVSNTDSINIIVNNFVLSDFVDVVLSFTEDIIQELK